MHRVLLPALLLLVIDGNAPREPEAIVDQALVQHLETLEQWVVDQTNPNGVWVPVPCILTWESTPPAAFEPALAVYEPFFAEMDALWSDPVSREHLCDGRLWRSVSAHLESSRECANLLVARAVHEARDIGDMQACMMHLEQALGYSRSTGTDSWGRGMSLCVEGLVTCALPQVFCSGTTLDSEAATRLTCLLGSTELPAGSGSFEREWWRSTRKSYVEHSADARQLIALAAR